MGYLLKEVLKMICGVNQWSYAVFWKIGSHNTTLLIWEECYCEGNLSSALQSTSGLQSSDFPGGKQKGWISAENRQARDGVHALIGKMMINNQVNVLGEGIVGRAAFTGHYQWLHLNNDYLQAHPPEVLNELNQQFAAGMQTVAVIPVLPHGVVQLGSSLAIMENMAFLNHVKSMILQLGCISGALLSDGFASKETVEITAMPVSLGRPVSVDAAGNNHGIGAIPLRADTSKQQYSLCSLAGQPSHSLTRNLDNPNTSDTVCEAPSVIQSWPKIFNGNNQPNGGIRVSQAALRTSGLDNGFVGAEVIPSNPSAWLNQHASSPNFSSEIRHQTSNGLGIGQSNSKSLEELSLSNAVFQQHDCTSDNFVASRIKADQSAMLNSCAASSSRLNSGTVLQSGMTSLLRPSDIPCSQFNPFKGVDVKFSCSNVVGSVSSGFDLHNQVENMATSTIACGGSDSVNARRDPNEVDLFQALNIQLSDPEKYASLSEHVPSFATSFQNICDRGQTSMSSNAEFEGTCGQHSSGSDLFDILGSEFKNNLNCNTNKFITNEQKVSTKNLHYTVPGNVNMQDVGSSLFSLSEGITDSDIFSVTGADHLLDAVVSQAQPAASQRSGDNLSSGTLTKISSSSVPSSTSSYPRINVSDRPQGKLLNLPKLLVEGGTSGSGSFMSGSGCSKENMRNCSQGNSIYGSHMSSWVEQGHIVKRESSISTAYSKKSDQTSKSNRKRLKPGENPRPRPKDRQMIQDRVKELREIVPNGAKCSIDALLERTIKHMLFLQSVTKHADQLKQTGEPKIINKEGGLALRENFEGGATWAFEVGSNSMVCPIIVEDLNPPRQLMVEMLCEENGFFLELADLIRGMGLTILKGVMESRNDKIWARFAVEANRDVTRVEVFMSLVRLLEQTVKGASSVSASDNNLTINQSFPQAASVPVTNHSNSLL